MDNKTELQKDMYILAKPVHELSEKHGGIYINSVRCKDSDIAWAIYGENLQSYKYEYYLKEKKLPQAAK